MFENGSGDIVAVDNSNEVTEVEQKPEAAEATEVTAPAETQEENNAGEVHKKKRPTGFSRKISRLEQQLAEANARLAEVQKPVTSDKEPQLDDFPSYDAYNNALIDYRVTQTISAREQARKQEEVKAKEIEKQQAVDKTWQEKLDALDDSYSDYDEVVGKFKGITVSQAIFDAITEAGPEIAYHLAKDEALASRISEMSPLQVAKEILKIEQRLTSKPAVKVSKSSEPITPVKGTVKTAAVKLESLDTDSYIAQRYPHLSR